MPTPHYDQMLVQPERTHEAAATKHSQQEHLTPHELTRQEQERAQEGQTQTVGHGTPSFGHREIAELAHQYWEERGRPEGSSEEDWHRAVKELRSRALGH